jgi:hypothetical protein
MFLVIQTNKERGFSWHVCAVYFFFTTSIMAMATATITATGIAAAEYVGYFSGPYAKLSSVFQFSI